MMYRISFYFSIITIVFFSFLQPLYAQQKADLSGRWEGTMDNGEHLTVCIAVKNNKLCGYTADYVLTDPESHCKANFRGSYDEHQRMWILMGTVFIENSGSHVLMTVRLGRNPGDNANTLHGTVEEEYGSGSFFGMGNDRDALLITRVSSKLPPDMPHCFHEVIRPSASASRSEATIMPAPKKAKPMMPAKKPPVKKPVPPNQRPIVPARKLVVIKPDSVKVMEADTSSKIIKPLLAPLRINQPALLQKMNARKNTEFSHIVVHSKTITLNVYDNGIVDNDTVSIFYNGKLIAGRKGLSEKPFVIKLELDENAASHEIVMFAENLGSIPPNTALIVMTVDGKRYELHSSSSLTENAVLRLDYQPE